MKNLYLFFLISIIVLPIYAQQPNSQIRGSRGYVPPSRNITGTYIDLVDPIEETNIIQQKCITEFNLDAFEKEILKNILIKKFESQNVILADEKNNRETRRKKINDLEKNFYNELSTILTVEEIEQYKLMDFTVTKEKKRKKKRKRKKRKT